MTTKPIEATLLGTGQTLYRAIANRPAVWLGFALRIESKVIYREAMIHAVGQYNTNEMATTMTQFDSKVAAIVTKKAGKLSEAVKDSMMHVMTFFPPPMLRSNVHNLANIDHFGRNSYSNDILSWMAITFFRQYLAQHIAGDKSHNAEDTGFALIKAIGKGGDAYLDKNHLEQFHQYFPMSNRAKAVVENKINEVKESVKVFTKVSCVLSRLRQGCALTIMRAGPAEESSSVGDYELCSWVLYVFECGGFGVSLGDGFDRR